MSSRFAAPLLQVMRESYAKSGGTDPDVLIQHADKLAVMVEGTYTRLAEDAPDTALSEARAHLYRTVIPLARATAQALAAPFTLAFDLDDTALQFPERLVPLAHLVKQGGGRIIVLTANRHQAARQMWDDLGYPEPDVYAVFDDVISGDDVGIWKAQKAAELGVDLLIDDFMRGISADAYRTHAGRHLGLQLLVPPGIPQQSVKRLKAWKTERITDTYAVPDHAIPPVAAMMTEFLAPDPYDPDFLGQDIYSVYYDTPEKSVQASREAGLDYLVVRLRTYGSTGDSWLEAKSLTAKVRAPLDAGEAAQVRAGIGVVACLYARLPECAPDYRRLYGDSPLEPVSTVSYRRYARETGDSRMTLDVGIHAGPRTYPDAVLECKWEGNVMAPPALATLPITPIDISKFLLSVQNLDPKGTQ